LFHFLTFYCFQYQIVDVSYGIDNNNSFLPSWIEFYKNGRGENKKENYEL